MQEHWPLRIANMGIREKLGSKKTPPSANDLFSSHSSTSSLSISVCNSTRAMEAWQRRFTLVCWAVITELQASLYLYRFYVRKTKQQIWEILPGGEKGQMYPDVELKTMPATAGQVTDSEAGDPPRRVQTWASRNSDCTWFTFDFLDYLSSTFHPPRERLHFASNDRPPG